MCREALGRPWSAPLLPWHPVVLQPWARECIESQESSSRQCWAGDTSAHLLCPQPGLLFLGRGAGARSDALLAYGEGRRSSSYCAEGEGRKEPACR